MADQQSPIDHHHQRRVSAKFLRLEIVMVGPAIIQSLVGIVVVWLFDKSVMAGTSQKAEDDEGVTTVRRSMNMSSAKIFVRNTISQRSPRPDGDAADAPCTRLFRHPHPNNVYTTMKILECMFHTPDASPSLPYSPLLQLCPVGGRFLAQGFACGCRTLASVSGRTAHPRPL